MANSLATYSVGNSLVSYLKKAYAAQQEITQPFDFRLISSGEFADSTEPSRNTLTLFLYRITQSADLRGPVVPGGRNVAPPPLALELHYLVTAWADDARMEQTVLTWAMRALQMNPVLDSSSLTRGSEVGCDGYGADRPGRVEPRRYVARMGCVVSQVPAERGVRSAGSAR